MIHTICVTFQHSNYYFHFTKQLAIKSFQINFRIWMKCDIAITHAVICNRKKIVCFAYSRCKKNQQQPQPIHYNRNDKFQSILWFGPYFFASSIFRLSSFSLHYNVQRWQHVDGDQYRKLWSSQLLNPNRISNNANKNLFKQKYKTNRESGLVCMECCLF